LFVGASFIEWKRKLFLRETFRPTIPPDVTDDVNFIAFRFYAKAPMVGYRSMEVFHIGWLDRDYSLYDHE
jgi:hypothetical protein